MAYTNIDDPSAYFHTQLYAGTGSAQSITNDGNSDLQPDLLWIKSRSDSSFHAWTDSTRGTNLRIYSNSTAAEESHTDRVTAFNSDGFSLGTSSLVNTNTFNYAAWQWKANGGTTSSNTDGDITSTVQANTDANFSIVTYTGNFTATQTVGHGLGVRPDVVIIKNRDTAVDWVVWTSELTSGNFLKLNDTDAQASSSRIYQAGFTTSTFGIGANNSVNKSGDDLIAYCFASKQGYSKFGKYVGNGSTDGSFVYTGFKPAFVIIKRTDQPVNWDMFTGKISPFNKITDRLRANLPDAENTGLDRLNFFSNGFKMINNYTSGNTSGGTYIYMAFAENPFVTSTGIPTTAR